MKTKQGSTKTFEVTTNIGSTLSHISSFSNKINESLKIKSSVDSLSTKVHLIPLTEGMDEIRGETEDLCFVEMNTGFEVL